MSRASSASTSRASSRATSREEQPRDPWTLHAQALIASCPRPTAFDALLRQLLVLSLREAAPPVSGGADLLQECLTAVLPVCDAPILLEGLTQFCIGAESEPGFPREPPFIDACNAALRELKTLQIPGRSLLDPVDIQMAKGKCRRHPNCDCPPDFVLLPCTHQALSEQVAETAVSPEDVFACGFFSFRPGGDCPDPPASGYTTKCSTKINALEYLKLYTVHAPRPGAQPISRCAMFAAETLAQSPNTPFVLGLFILDSTVHVACFDRQGIAYLSGLDFIEDLPRFLVLLFALQRLPRTMTHPTHTPAKRERGQDAILTGSRPPGGEDAPRVLQVIIAERLKPLSQLWGQPFVKGWFQAQEAHYKAWTSGIKHREITANTLLYRES
ncbi:hypothetical protein BD626DRAFT_513143 [Schizophyllum amplum]|uniref:Fungal-type protein kinase domain-containing protein n=1 Tax=Schizophyllum amplum TaxID=97359 RepID=A0A550BZ93_9AGAR|nr:hypothetical protein BD626DRAFT_513143 [Auriculariopsis ampla]